MSDMLTDCGNEVRALARDLSRPRQVTSKDLQTVCCAFLVLLGRFEELAYGDDEEEADPCETG